MQAGSLADGVVFTPTSRVVVDGVERPHVSWSVDRELSGDLPDQVVSGSGLTQATGTIVWASDEPVTEAGDNPWNPQSWWPSKGARVEIYAGDGTSEWRQFTGVIDNTAGSLGGPMQSRIIDEIDRLSVRFSHDPLLRKMPPLTEGGDYRYADLVPSYHIDYAMRRAGFNATPRQEPNTVVYAPFMGGCWPHVGTLTAAGSYDGSDSTAANRPTPWGFGIGNGEFTYSVRHGEPSSTPVQITLAIAPDHAGPCNVQVNYTGGRWVRLHIAANRRPFAWSNGSGTATNVCNLTAAQMDGATVVTMLVKGGNVSLRNDQGAQSSGTTSAVSGTSSTVTVTAYPDANVGGLMVNHPKEAYQEHRPSIQWGNPQSDVFRRRAVIDTSNISHLSVIVAAPAIENRSAQSVIDEISDALLAASWIDEHGTLRWSTGLALRWTNVVDTITTRDDVLALGWEDSLLGARSGVTVTYRRPYVTESRFQSAAVWRGASTTLNSNEVHEDIITPPAEETWVMVDTDYAAIGPYNYPLYNRKRGSYMGVVATKGNEYYSPAGLPIAYGIEQIGPQAWKVTHTTGALPAGVQLETRTADSDEYGPGLYSWNRDNTLPLVQAGSRVQWVDQEASTSVPDGMGPVLEHDVGPWAAFNIAENIAAYLQGATSAPLPTITNLDVWADPRRQLGDHLFVTSPALMKARLRAMVSAISTSFDSSGPRLSQSLGTRIIGAEMLGQTYAEFNAAGGQLTYGQWNALSTATYQQFNNEIE